MITFIFTITAMGKTITKAKSDNTKLNKKTRKIILIILWIGAFLPLLAILFMLGKADEKVPGFEALANPPEKQASIIYTTDKVEMGRFWSVNRKSIAHSDISPYVFSALIATEDARYTGHSGVDFWGVGRALTGAAIGSNKGGASTISQQLAKLLYTLEDTVNGGVSKDKWGRLEQKFGENILAVRLEKQFTKAEIITMYLNNFDFLYNAVGISSAAQVYFNKKPIDLKMEEAAMLIGMCKNPSMYNPLRFQYRNYDVMENGERQYILDSTRAYNRRNTVLNQWYKNSDDAADNGVEVKITKEQCDSLKALPIIVDYQIVDHKEGLAPHFREELRKELTATFNEKDENGNYIISKPGSDGKEGYNIYKDGLRIHTTLDSRLQKYAEEAVQQHMETTLQKEFAKNNAKNKNPPFANDAKDKHVEQLMNNAIRYSGRYQSLKRAGKSKAEIDTIFNTPVPMKVFSYTGDFDTIMTPTDSIKYYKGIIQAGLMSMDPKTGFIKAWVGGPSFTHFSYDHVKQSKRQVGSTIKPFVYAAAIRFGVIDPCKAYVDMDYCIDVPVSPTKTTSWCPSTGTENTGDLITTSCGLAGSLNNITVAIMRDMGPTAGPAAMKKLLQDVGIDLRKEDVVPAMCLGPMDLSLYEMVGAQASFANKGLYIEPLYIMRVEDRNGNVIIELEPNMKEAMSEELAYTMLGMMKGAVVGARNPYQGNRFYATSSTLRGARSWGGLKYPMAGKTGTTDGAADGWFMGLTSDLVTGVWAGANDPQIHFRSYPWGQGARMALPIFGYYMQRVYKDKKLDISTKDFEAPPQFDQSIFRCSKSQDFQGF